MAYLYFFSMQNISTHFKLLVKQPNLIFIDVKLDDDNELFIAPRLIEQSAHPTIKPMADVLYKYFAHLMMAVSSDDMQKAHRLLSGIHEPKETRLGYGFLNSDGKSSGPRLKNELVDAILTNPLLREKKLNNIGDVAFFIRNFNCDRLSDITTKIIESYLIAFTQEQCRTLGINLKKTPSSKEILNPSTLEWEKHIVELPIFNDGVMDRPIIFVPKSIVWRKGGFNSNLNCFYRFARNYIIDINDVTFLSGVLRNGKDDAILVKDFDSLNKDKKDALMKWVSKYQDLPNNFWLQPKGNLSPLSDAEIEEVVYTDRNQKAA